ncbi:hypothetical protein T484DRAFT_1893099, partial [Baffinella frigidus]
MKPDKLCREAEQGSTETELRTGFPELIANGLTWASKAVQRSPQAFFPRRTPAKRRGAAASPVAKVEPGVGESIGESVVALFEKVPTVFSLMGFKTMGVTSRLIHTVQGGSPATPRTPRLQMRAHPLMTPRIGGVKHAPQPRPPARDPDGGGGE